MSITFTLSDTSSVLEANIFPPIQLNGEYEIGLISFLTYNSIPNVDLTNNLFHYGEKNLKFIEIPIGSYEIADLSNVINDLIKKRDGKDSGKVIITTNNNTLTCIIKCTKKIYFNNPRSIGSLLGFNNRIITANVESTSNTPINIMKVSAIRVECNIASSSYMNGERSHTIHEFYPNVPSGFKIIEQPKNIIYSSVAAQSIDNISLKIVDQVGELIDFRGEIITIRIHLKKC